MINEIMTCKNKIYKILQKWLHFVDLSDTISMIYYAAINGVIIYLFYRENAVRFLRKKGGR